MNNSKDKLHPRSFHNKPYNFQELILKVPELKQFIVKNREGVDTVQFADPKAVYLLNKALLLHFYSLDFWDIPNQNLIPPIPGRADYVHYLADLLKVDDSDKNTVLDIGTGASLVYPLIGSSVYNWNFAATDIEPKSIEIAQEIIDKNPHLSSKITLRLQPDKKQILSGIIIKDDYFDAVMCNPPFFKSKKEAEAQTIRKLKGLDKRKTPKLINNFSGESNELWFNGGELSFVLNYIKESVLFKTQVGWFTSLISNEDNLKPLQIELKKSAKEIKVIDMAQGNKKSRILAWRF
ncbi:23S rRNA (adenine(1618)-N(6))-methyltransferase RlmF [Paenimyroides baculatum]|uniref:Ribosomal RNA large subunit methyltransferase F n=1 Tax=Paenimyroides baculatum TaxID=2608000 RepID=A0A5M6CJD4_9FLAO|nr:23S rRNA (adenine(1618)-N(6))-methyltransferase RlmF [Paenimyroides baculatum]KAA5535321.1 23S rRNA (adenine(1618)-N(6))-methyltransferase RlmF [Paenimyroides baculatum]